MRLNDQCTPFVQNFELIINYSFVLPIPVQDVVCEAA